ncbi:tetratricopeptide repeat protein 32 isoform X3 [Ictalurus furcatus]|uniref:tetratricopeptide repeat protein 32 isoform X3 n=1 Tax=Ictalurus furcatus TaxID=66913 RepID=UPI00234FFE65|nr:tetratricopeptide repeat protein 32 isoform X3 [Ictalurus furcatus]
MEGHREVLDRQNLLNEANNEFNSHHWKRAEDLYTEFIDICMASGERDSNDLAIAFNNRGQVKYFRVDFYEAVDDYSAAIKANRQFEVAYYNRGLIRYRLGLATVTCVVCSPCFLFIATFQPFLSRCRKRF